MFVYLTKHPVFGLITTAVVARALVECVEIAVTKKPSKGIIASGVSAGIANTLDKRLNKVCDAIEKDFIKVCKSAVMKKASDDSTEETTEEFLN